MRPFPPPLSSPTMDMLKAQLTRVVFGLNRSRLPKWHLLLFSAAWEFLMSVIALFVILQATGRPHFLQKNGDRTH